jgi:hypothetical protein
MYWAACIIAALTLAAMAYLLTVEPHPDFHKAAFLVWFFSGFALVVWLIGRAVKYVLAGK